MEFCELVHSTPQPMTKAMRRLNPYFKERNSGVRHLLDEYFELSAMSRYDIMSGRISRGL
jgi:hypothetical protein